MTEYIEREALIKRIVNTTSEATNKAFEQKEYNFSLTLDRLVDRQNEIIDMITAADAADVAPVRHGKWTFYSSHGEDEYEWQCSACNDWANHPYAYCPNCGARCDVIKEDKNGERKDTEQIELNLFDQEEIIYPATVQILRNSITGDESVGWWQGSPEDMGVDAETTDETEARDNG